MKAEKRRARRQVRHHKKLTKQSSVVVRGEVSEAFIKHMAAKGVQVIRVPDATTASG